MPWLGLLLPSLQLCHVASVNLLIAVILVLTQILGQQFQKQDFKRKAITSFANLQTADGILKKKKEFL